MKNKIKNFFYSFNIYDLLIIVIFILIFDFFILILDKMTEPFRLNNINNISLEVKVLPEYAFRTILRMFISLFISLFFTFLIAPLAAKNEYCEKIIIPFIDIMESIPILGFLAVSTIAFINLFPNNILGPELAAIFVIFTSQVWNMILSLYQSLRNLPQELEDVSKVFLLSKWKKFWCIEIPYALPNLIWNIMISMSASWFFIVYSEAISIANQDIFLPGIGSYIGKAISQADFNAIGYAMSTMFIIIITYDQILCKPILSWSERFKLKKNIKQKKKKKKFYHVLFKSNIYNIFYCFTMYYRNNVHKINFILQKIYFYFSFYKKKKNKKNVSFYFLYHKILHFFLFILEYYKVSYKKCRN